MSEPSPMKCEVLIAHSEGLDPTPRLPHAYPFHLLDRAVVLAPGRWAAGMRNLTRDDPLLDAEGRLAPVLLAEAMAQTAGLAASEGSESAAAPVLGQIDRFRCRQAVVVGDQLLVVARVMRRFGAAVKVRASVKVDGRLRAAAEFVLHFPQPSRREQ